MVVDNVNANRQMTHFANLNVTRPMCANRKLTHLLAKHDQDPHGVSNSFRLLLILLSALGALFWLGFAGRLPVFHPLAPPLDGNRLGMVKKPIEQSRCQHLIAQ